ncbi:MAG: hypothetical protein KIS66_01125 [Fimbriimonadaceae bacterium]|nr:hypothetical protein [Fimbriimonadaceae bacterium]
MIAAIGVMCTMALGADEATTARLLTAGPTLAPGTPLAVGVEIAPPNGWHTYWKNPGDSGLPTTVEWVLPKGWKATALEWPTPIAFEADGIVGFGYEGKVVLLASVVPPPNAKPGEYPLRAEVTWLACKDGCYPGKATLTAKASIGGANLQSPDAKILQTWRTRVPATPLPGARARANAEGWSLSWTGPAKDGPPRFFPDQPATVDHAALVGTSSGGQTTIFLKRSDYLQGSPKRLRGVLAFRDRAFLVDVPIEQATKQEVNP